MGGVELVGLAKVCLTGIVNWASPWLNLACLHPIIGPRLSFFSVTQAANFILKHHSTLVPRQFLVADSFDCDTPSNSVWSPSKLLMRCVLTLQTDIQDSYSDVRPFQTAEMLRVMLPNLPELNPPCPKLLYARHVAFVAALYFYWLQLSL